MWPADDPTGTHEWDPGAPCDDDAEAERLATLADEQIDMGDDDR